MLLTIDGVRGLLRSSAVYVPVIAVAALSRVVVFLAGRFGQRHLPLDPTSPTDVSSAPAWFHWDALHYLEITAHGYATEVLTAHFPLYPLLGAVVARLTGLPAGHALLLIANLCFLLAVILLFDVARGDLGPEAGIVAVASLSFFPSTVFLSVAYPESLFVLLSLATFRSLQSGRLWGAAVFAGLAAASRPFGWALGIPVLVEAWKRSGDEWPRRLLHSGLLGLVSVSGLLAYVAYLAVAFGQPLVFIAPYRESTPLAAFLPWRLLGAALTSDSREALVNTMFFVGFAVVTALGLRRLAWRYSAFSLALLVLFYWRGPYFAHPADFGHLLFFGLHRYVLAVAPFHLAVGALLGEKRGYTLAIIALASATSVFWTGLYVQGYAIR